MKNCGLLQTVQAGRPWPEKRPCNPKRSRQRTPRAEAAPTWPVAAQRWGRQAGLSLVELMVALLIGLGVVGTVLAAYVGSGMSSRHSTAMAQMADDAAVALNVLRQHLAMAGYSRPAGVDRDGTRFARVYTGPALFGCDSAFANLAVDIDDLACQPADDASDAIAVAFEADLHNSLANADGTHPLDCLGNAITGPRRGVPPNDHWLSYSRWYVDRPEGTSTRALHCRGPGAPGAQALVENIERLEILYGVAEGSSPHVARYEPASALSRAAFERVLTVRVCVVVASAVAVMDQVTAYAGCDPYAEPILPAAGDRRLFKAFTSTIVLHNRVEVLP